LKNIRLGALLEKYLAYCEQNNRAKTYKRKRPFTDYILTFFRDAPLSTITTDQVEAFKAHRRRTVGPATVNREMAALKQTVELA
jgi:hypothetical protein